MMYFQNSEIEPTTGLRHPRNTRLIDGVRQQKGYNSIVQNVFNRRGEENPYALKVELCTNLSRELKNDQRKEYLQEKRRQQLRGNNHELRFLETQIRAAYVRKTLKAQIFERKAFEDEAILENQSLNVDLDLESFTKRTEEEERLKKLTTKEDLDEQMADLNLKRMEEYKSVMNDQQKVDEAVKQYRKDLEREAREAAEKKARTREEMEEFLRSKEEWKRTHSQADKEDEERLLEFVRQRQREQDRAKQEKKAQQQRREEWVDEMGQKLHAAKMEKIKASDALAELLVDERNANEEMAERKELELKMHHRNELRLQMEREFEEKQRRKEAQKKNDEEIFQMQMRMLAERDKLEQLSDERRHRKEMEHRRALLQELEEKRRKKAKQALKDFHKRDLELEEKAKMKKEIEAERVRMIKEHAEVLDFMAPGVVSESERILATKNL